MKIFQIPAIAESTETENAPRTALKTLRGAFSVMDMLLKIAGKRQDG